MEWGRASESTKKCLSLRGGADFGAQGGGERADKSGTLNNKGSSAFSFKGGGSQGGGGV